MPIIVTIICLIISIIYDKYTIKKIIEKKITKDEMDASFYSIKCVIQMALMLIIVAVTIFMSIFMPDSRYENLKPKQYLSIIDTPNMNKNIIQKINGSNLNSIDRAYELSINEEDKNLRLLIASNKNYANADRLRIVILKYENLENKEEKLKFIEEKLNI